MRSLPFLLVLPLLAGCTKEKKEEPGPGSLTLSLARDSGGTAILATAFFLDGDGEPVPGAEVTVSVLGGSAGAPTETADGEYVVTVTPTALDRVVEIEVEAEGLTAAKTALVLTTVGAGWDQAEEVEGLVNTAGWEDGPQVSPDGEWLLVASYSPVDIFSCILGGLDPVSAACENSLGPYAAPERPGLFGAERIESATHIVDVCPSLGVSSEIGFAFPPLAGYGFRRQEDGSYAEPFVIGFESDGCAAPFGYSFTGPPQGTDAEVVFAWDDMRDLGPGDTLPDLWVTDLVLGTPNVLGTFSYSGGVISASALLPVRLALPSLAGQQGNPSFDAGRLYWDDESLPDVDRDIYFSDVTGALPVATLSSAQVLGASIAGSEEIQPTPDGTVLYAMSGGAITTRVRTGADPSAPASWAAPETVVTPGTGSGAGTIVAVGEPTVARFDGSTWLYFVYVTETGTGYDANVGRIRQR